MLGPIPLKRGYIDKSFQSEGHAIQAGRGHAHLIRIEFSSKNPPEVQMSKTETETDGMKQTHIPDTWWNIIETK